jgi:hypothetical protein
VFRKVNAQRLDLPKYPFASVERGLQFRKESFVGGGQLVCPGMGGIGSFWICGQRVDFLLLFADAFLALHDGQFLYFFSEPKNVGGALAPSAQELVDTKDPELAKGGGNDGCGKRQSVRLHELLKELSFDANEELVNDLKIRGLHLKIKVITKQGQFAKCQRDRGRLCSSAGWIVHDVTLTRLYNEKLSSGRLL